LALSYQDLVPHEASDGWR